MSFQFYSTVHFLKCSCGPVDSHGIFGVPAQQLFHFFFFNSFTLNKKYYFNIFKKKHFQI